MNKKNIFMSHLMESRMNVLSRYSILAILSVAASIALAQDEALEVADTDTPAVAEVKLDDEQAKTSLEELVERQKDERDADAFLKKGNSAFEQQEFGQAVEYYLSCLDILRGDESDTEQAAANASKIDTVKQLISRSYFFWAEKTFMEAEENADLEDYDTAIEQCKEAVNYYPQAEEKAADLIAKYERMKASAEYRKDASREELIPDYKTREKRIALLLRQGSVLYQTKQWAKAQEKYNDVLVIDGYNITAIDMLRRIYIKQLEAGHRRRGAVILERHADSAWNLIAPIVTHSENAQDPDADTPITKIDVAGNTQKKLNEITIDRIDFDEVPIAQVVQFLKHISKDKDPDHVGVNFVLRFNTDAVAANAANQANENELSFEDENIDGTEDIDDNTDMEAVDDDIFGGETADSVFDNTLTDAETGEPIQTIDNTFVSLSVNDVTLFNAIRYICKSANLHFRVEEYAVVIAANDVPLDEFVRKTFPVEKEVFSLTNFSGDDVRQFFVDRGVPFPTGSTVRFDDATSRLTVYNTPEALELIEDMIEELNVSDPQVLIQVKFVEIEMNDMQELSFEYSFGRPAPSEEEAGMAGSVTRLDPTPYTVNAETGENEYEYANATNNFVMYYMNTESSTTSRNLGEAWARVTEVSQSDMVNSQNITVLSGSQYFIPENGAYYQGMLLNEMQGTYGSHMTWGKNDKMVRTADTDGGIFGTSTTLQNDNVFNWSTYNTYGYQFGGAIHALDQADSTEILSAPRVTTMNNENAVIKMITEKYYPDDWDDAELETVSTNGNNVPVFTPSIPNFGSATEVGIALQVRPSVEEDNYTIYLEMTPVIQEFVGWTDYSYSIPLGENDDLYPNTLKMPIIEARLLNTSVMSYDGETVVLGGVVKDELSMVEDQYPILGDLPIIGRFFQAKGKGSKKTNLLIFLTSRLIKPDGSSFRVEQSGRGVPSI